MFIGKEITEARRLCRGFCVMSRRVPIELPDEPSAEQRAELRRAARRLFRLYCIACGRATEGLAAPTRWGRCAECGGTMLLERSE
jgi:hypothetical protein